MEARRVYLWALFALGLTAVYFSTGFLFGENLFFCPFKKLTGVPCPSCGETRALAALVKGDVTGALMINPFCMLILPLVFAAAVVLSDLFTGRHRFFELYCRLETFISRPRNTFLAILLLASNWIWNIHKGL